MKDIQDQEEIDVDLTARNTSYQRLEKYSRFLLALTIQCQRITGWHLRYRRIDSEIGQGEEENMEGEMERGGGGMVALCESPS